MALSFTNHPQGINGKPKGFIRIVHGSLEQREHENDAWRRAVRLADIRDQLIRQASAAGTYRFPPKVGTDKNDVTSFHPTNGQWGPNRPDRAPILFQLRKTAAPGVAPRDVMQHAGRVILDQDDHRIRDFPELPSTLSTALEGHNIELYRRQNDKIDYVDLIGKSRMPASSTRLGRPDQPPPAPNTLQMRGKRFRVEAGCLSWLPREGSEKLRTHLENLLGPLCVSQNSSRSFGRDLTKAEQNAWLAVNKGSNPERRRRRNRGLEPEQVSDDKDEGADESESTVGGEDLDIKEELVDTDRVPASPSAQWEEVARKPRSPRPRPAVGYPFLSRAPSSSPAPAVKAKAKRRRRADPDSGSEDGPIFRPPPKSRRQHRAIVQEPQRPVAPVKGPLVNLNREPGSRSAHLMWSRVFANQQVPDDEAE